MGRLKGGANSAEEAEKLTLAELNTLIARAEWRFKDGGLNSAMRKDEFDRLVWLEGVRQKLHGIPAPERRRPKRGQS